MHYDLICPDCKHRFSEVCPADEREHIHCPECGFTPVENDYASMGAPNLGKNTRDWTIGNNTPDKGRDPTVQIMDNEREAAHKAAPGLELTKDGFPKYRNQDHLDRVKPKVDAFARKTYMGDEG